MAGKRRRKPSPDPPLSELMAAWDGLMRSSEDIDFEWSLRLQNLIGGAVMRHAWTQQEKDELRWAVSCGAIKLKGWDAAFEYAAEVLKGHWGHPAECGSDMMYKSYMKVQNTLKPFGQHRPLTWRRRKSPG